MDRQQLMYYRAARTALTKLAGALMMVPGSIQYAARTITDIHMLLEPMQQNSAAHTRAYNLAEAAGVALANVCTQCETCRECPFMCGVGGACGLTRGTMDYIVRTIDSAIRVYGDGGNENG